MKFLLDREYRAVFARVHRACAYSLGAEAIGRAVALGDGPE